MTDATRNRISILITAYRNADLVARCLDSLLAVCDGRLPETVLVDDAAGDAETRAVADRYAPHGLIFSVMPENGGFAGANNAGYRLCTKACVVLVNSDIVFHEEPFTAMLAFLDAHPKAGIVQGTLLIRNGQKGVDGSLNGCGAFLTPLGTTTTPGWLMPADDPVAREARPCFAAYGALFMLRREVVKATGDRLFHAFFHSYYEEVDLCHRAWLAGWEVWYVPTPHVDHAHGATFGKFLDRADILKRFYRNIRFSFATCFGWRGRLTVMPVFELLCWGQILTQLLRGKGAALRAHLWAYREISRLRPEIRKIRREIQATRTLSDTALFKRVMRRPPLRSFLQSIRGNL